MHRQLFHKLQPRQTAPAGKSDVIRNDKKALSRSAWVIKQKNGNLFQQVLFNHVNGILLVAYQAKKNKNPVILLSSSHAYDLVATNEIKKTSYDSGL